MADMVSKTASVQRSSLAKLQGIDPATLLALEAALKNAGQNTPDAVNTLAAQVQTVTALADLLKAAGYVVTAASGTLTGESVLTAGNGISVALGVNTATLALTVPVSGANGGTGVTNTGKTITLGGNVTTAGAFPLTLTLTGATNVTLPTSGTIAAYTSGLWTPSYAALTSNFTTVTYESTITGGKWWRNGPLVHVQGAIRTNSVVGGTGPVVIAGLPFAVAANTTGFDGLSALALADSTDFGVNHPCAVRAMFGQTYAALLYRAAANGATTNLLASDLSTAATKNTVYIGGTYITDAP